MSMYNTLFGSNPDAEKLLDLLGLSDVDVGRYRDCYLTKDEKEIAVFTRNGGGNRREHKDVFARLCQHPNYLRDEDDEYDNTYATIYFSIPSAKVVFSDALVPPPPPTLRATYTEEEEDE
jgi:hypothetical protein